MTRLRKFLRITRLPWKLFAFVLAISMMLSSMAEACRRCGRSSCGGCNYSATVKAPLKKAPVKQALQDPLLLQGASLFGLYNYGTNKQYQPLSTSNFTFGKDDPLALMNKSERAFELAGKNYQNAAAQHHAALVQDGQNKAKLAKIFAIRDAFVAMYNVSDSGDELQSKTIGFKAEYSNGKWQVQPNGDQGSAPAAPVAGRMNLQQSIRANCSACHGNAIQKGGLNLDNIDSFDAATVKGIIDKHLLTDVEADRMPKNADGTPGERLSTEALMPWFELYGQLQAKGGN